MSVYELQLAGYEIERVPCEHRNGRTTLAYRLRRAGADHRPVHVEGGGQRWDLTLRSTRSETRR